MHYAKVLGQLKEARYLFRARAAPMLKNPSNISLRIPRMVSAPIPVRIVDANWSPRLKTEI